ncbi:MAG: dockerin type I domain-containing protein [Bacteroidota bacterium]
MSFLKTFFWVIFTFVLFVCTNPFTAKAQGGVLACNDTIHLSLDNNCQAVLTPDVLLEAPDTSDIYRIFITAPKDSIGAFSNNQTDSVIIQKTGLFQYSVVDTTTNSCWGYIVVEDKLKPTFLSLPTDTIVRCTVDLTEAGISATKPTATDNCATVQVKFDRAYVELGDIPCDTARIVSLWTAIDSFGNTVSDTQRTVFIRPNVSQLIRPLDSITLSCGQDSLTDINNLDKTGRFRVQTGRITNGAFVPLDTVLLNDDNHCTFAFSKQDVIENSTNCETKLSRYWRLLDWCTLSAVPTFIDTQVIVFTDTLAPVFQRVPNDNLQNASKVELGENCLFKVEVAPPIATDNCDTMPTVEMYEVAQLVAGNWTPIGTNVNTTPLPADTLRLGYRTFDNCPKQNKEDSTFTYVITQDRTAPAVICANNLVISIGDNNGVKLTAETVDGGSFDACGVITKEIRRMDIDSAWQSSINLTCEMVGMEIMLELRIIDAAGNQNFCMTSVRLEDKVSPICQPLDSLTVFCDTLHTDDFGQITDANGNSSFDDAEWREMSANQVTAYNETFGNPACKENVACRSFTIQQQYQRLSDGCGAGTILRRFRGVDAQGNIGAWVEQQITVNYRADWDITLPPDWEGDCNDTIPAPFIDLRNGNCGALRVNVTEKRFTTGEDYCVKVERIYQIINSCLYTPSTPLFTIIRPEDSTNTVRDTFQISSDSLASQGLLRYKQILKIRSTNRPNLFIPDISSCLSNNQSDSIPNKIDSVNTCAVLRTFRASATDCTGGAVERFEWQFFENDSLKATGVGDSFMRAVTPTIDYTVQFTAIDNCNNRTTDRRDFTFVDCEKPTLFIANGITLELKNRTIEIEAKDFDRGSSDNCTDKTTLQNNFRIWNRRLAVPRPQTIASVKALPTSLTLTCDDLASQEVFIFAFDEADNFTTVETFIVVQDNQNSCVNSGTTNINGKIITEQGVNVENVAVAISGAMVDDQMTPADGAYAFAVRPNGSYQIRPTKRSNPLNGVTTFDLILISKHILGIQPFGSPYQHIAADVNKSGTITAFDLVQLRQLILNLIPDFPSNDSWRFVDKQYQFQTKNPAKEPFKEFIEIGNKLDREQALDFIGVKIGDLDGNVRANRLTLAKARQIQAVYSIPIRDVFVEKGSTVKVPFSLQNIETVAGAQFALNFEGLTVTGLTEGQLHVEHFNVENIAKGQLKASWHQVENNNLSNELFTVTFRATKSGFLSDLLSIGMEGIQPELYTTDDEIQTIVLDFRPHDNWQQFKLLQNRPNPFSESTTIGFYLPSPTKVKLDIVNMQGQILKTVQGDYGAGLHEVRLDKEVLGGNGILYYRMKAGEIILTKEMVVL